MLVRTAQELVDKAASAPPGDMDDAHPGAHPDSDVYKNLNPMSYGHKGMYARQKDMGHGKFEEPERSGTTYSSEHHDEL